jgi:outer membrane protein assembly factor BamB
VTLWAHRPFAHRAVRLFPLAVLGALLAVGVVARDRGAPRASLSARQLQGAPSAQANLASPSPEVADAKVAPHVTTFHGDPARSGRARGALPEAPHLLWTFDAGGPIAAQVTTTEDAQTLFVVTLTGRLSAVDRVGRARWSLELGNRIYSSPLVLEDRILLGTDQGQFLAVSHAGKILWRLVTEGDADTSALRAGPLVVFAAGRRVYALDSNGVVKWRYQSRRKIFSSPTLTTAEQIAFGSQDRHVVALSTSGAELWRTDVGGHVDSAPASGPDGSVYVGSDAHEVIKLDARGGVVWKCNVGGYVRGSLTVARNGDIVAGTYGPSPKVVRISPDGVLIRAFGVGGTGAKEFGIHGSPIEDDRGRFAFGAQDNVVRVLSPRFDEEWKFSTGADVDAALTLLADGTLLVPSEDGKLYALAR